MNNIKAIPDFLKHIEATYQDKFALNEIQNEKWVSYSTQEVIKKIHALAASFHQMGVKKGQTIGLYAPSSARWVIVDMAILIAGGITVPIFANISHSGFEYIVKDSGMKTIYVEGEQEVQEILPIISQFDGVVLQNSTHTASNIFQLGELIKNGTELLTKKTELINSLINQISEEDIATFIYTSGSTGSPKGVELTHKNLVSQIVGARQRFEVEASKDTALSCLPLPHIFERMVMYFYFSQGVSIYFADDIKNLASLLPKVKPTILTVVPRLLEKVQAGVITKSRNASFIKKNIAHYAFARASTKDPLEPAGLLDKIYDRLVYVKIRNALGGNLKYLISGGSALSKDLCRFFLNLGVPVYQGYGMTECSPVITSSFPGANMEGYVGLPFPMVEVKIDTNGEILVKGPGIMKGYHNKPEATKESIDAAGWFHTGDMGQLNEKGMLKITGRIKEIFKTSNGKYVSPVKLEQLLVGYYLIDMAMIIGENYKFVSCILFLDPVHLAKLKEKANKSQMKNEDFVKEEEVVSKIDSFIKELNKGVDHWEQIQKFHIATESLSIEDGSLTPTMKIRRHIVCERYKKVIEKMYEEK